MNPLSKDRKKSNARGVRRIRFPTRDRFGPDRMLDMVERVWFSIDPVHSDIAEGEFGGLRENLSDDLFRMGHVLLQMGIFELATEHLGEAFRLAPTAESATFVGWALNEMDDAWGLGWCRKAIETDERLGNPWKVCDIGSDPFANGAVIRLRQSLGWLASNSLSALRRARSSLVKLGKSP